MNEWYLADKKDYQIFSAKYPLKGEIKEQEAEIEKMKDWCDKAEIVFTPTIYVNGHRLQEKYNPDSNREKS